MSAEREIENLALRYASGLDHRDWAEVRAQFAAECHAEGKFGAAPIDEYLPKMKAFLAGYGKTMHFSGNRLVRLESADKGSLESYSIAVHLEPVEGGPAWIAGVIYLDQVARFEEGWKIARRKVNVLWESNDPNLVPVLPASSG